MSPLYRCHHPFHPVHLLLCAHRDGHCWLEHLHPSDPQTHWFRKRKPVSGDKGKRSSTLLKTQMHSLCHCVGFFFFFIIRCLLRSRCTAVLEIRPSELYGMKMEVLVHNGISGPTMEAPFVLLSVKWEHEQDTVVCMCHYEHDQELDLCNIYLYFLTNMLLF